MSQSPEPLPSGKHPLTAVSFLGRHLLLVGLTPLGVFGIAVGATTVVLKLGDSTIQIAGIAIIWGASTIVGILSIFAGLRAAASLCRSIPVPNDPAESTIAPAMNEPPDSADFPNLPPRYQTLTPINPAK